MISEFIGYSSIFMAYFVTAMCFLMMQRYSCTVSLGKAFMFLGLAFMFYGIAETVWYVLDYQEIEPYQNYPDIFYVGYYVFSILHVIETLRYFTTKGRTLQLWEYLSIFLIISVSCTVFAGLTYDIEGWLYGLPFVFASSSLGILALLGVIRVFFTKLSFTWLLIGTSILIASFVDIHYYMIETLRGYDYGLYPVIDIAWFVTDIIMVMAIVLHRRAI